MYDYSGSDDGAACCLKTWLERLRTIPYVAGEVVDEMIVAGGWLQLLLMMEMVDGGGGTGGGGLLPSHS